MDESALLSALTSLEMRWSLLEFWLKVCASVVVLGVIVEVFVVIRERRQDWREFRRGTIHSPDKPPISDLVWGLLGPALVAIGVSGELYVGIKAGKVETEMRNDNRLLVGLVNTRAKQAEQHTAIANAAAEQAKTDLAEYKLGRRLKPEQKKHLIEVLSKYQIASISIASRQGDGEAFTFGDDFELVFHKAGWKGISRGRFDPRGEFMGMNGKIVTFPPPGVTIRVENPADPPPAARALLDTLNKLSIRTKFVAAAETVVHEPPPHFTLQIGAK